MSERKMVVCPGHTIFTSRSIAWRRKCELAVSLFKLLIVFTINHSFIFFTITTLNLPGKNVYNVISLENVCFGMHIYNKRFFRWGTHIYIHLCLSLNISHELYTMWLSSFVHMCKMMISPGVFFIFSNFCFSGSLAR